MRGDCFRTLEFGDRAAWLNERRARIGSSEIAGICGMGYADQTPYTIWLEKTEKKSLPKSADFEKLMAIGHAAEPFLRELFKIETGRAVGCDTNPTVRINDQYPAFAASLDGWVDEGDGTDAVWEAKFIGVHTRPDYMADELPLKYAMQIQLQMAVTGASKGYLMAVCGNEPIIREIPRHDRLIDAMHAHAVKFLRMVEDKTPPPVDGNPATTKAITLRYGKPQPGKIVALPPEFDGHAERIARLKDLQKEHAEEEARLKNQIREAMGSAEWAYLSDLATFSWKVQGGSRVFKAAKATPHVRLHFLDQNGG